MVKQPIIKKKMKTIHLTLEHWELLYNLKSAVQTYDEIVGQLIDETISRREKEYKENNGEQNG